MPPTVKRSHTVSIEGQKLTLADLQSLINTAFEAGAELSTEVQVTHYNGHQLDPSTTTITVVIA